MSNAAVVLCAQVVSVAVGLFVGWYLRGLQPDAGTAERARIVRWLYEARVNVARENATAIAEEIDRGYHLRHR